MAQGDLTQVTEVGTEPETLPGAMSAWVIRRGDDVVVHCNQASYENVEVHGLVFEQVADARQLMRENRHLGKISILVGAEYEVLGKTVEAPESIRAEVGG